MLLVMDLNNLLKPLLKIEDVIKIIEYTKIVPQGVPDRYEHIRNVFNLNIKEQNSSELSIADVARLVQTLETLLPRFGDNPADINRDSVEKDLQNYISKGISEIGTVNIIPPLTTCCGSLRKSGQKTCIVYRSRFRPVVGVMYELKCSKCNTVYKCSTYKRKGLELYYNDVLEQEYFMSTCDSVFSMEFMRRIDIDM